MGHLSPSQGWLFAPAGTLTTFPLLQLLIPVTVSIRLKVGFKSCTSSHLLFFFSCCFEAELNEKWSCDNKSLPWGSSLIKEGVWRVEVKVITTYIQRDEQKCGVLCVACWRPWAPGSGVSRQDEGDLRFPVKLLLITLFNVSSLQRKTCASSLYVASYVMMHSAISTRCYTVILKLNQPVFFPHFSIHFICTMHWVQWSSGGTKNPAACFWPHVGIITLICILFEREWSLFSHSPRADSTASGWVHILRHKRAAVWIDRKCRQLRTLYPQVTFLFTEFHRGGEEFWGKAFLALPPWCWNPIDCSRFVDWKSLEASQKPQIYPLNNFKF